MPTLINMGIASYVFVVALVVYFLIEPVFPRDDFILTCSLLYGMRIRGVGSTSQYTELLPYRLFPPVPGYTFQQRLIFDVSYDPYKDQIYWIEHTNNFSSNAGDTNPCFATTNIGRVNFDGSDPEYVKQAVSTGVRCSGYEIAEYGHGQPAIDLHVKSRLIYWVSENTRSTLALQRATINGTEIKTVAEKPISSRQFYRISVDQNSGDIYWVTDGNIYRVSPDGRIEMTIRGSSRYYGISSVFIDSSDGVFFVENYPVANVSTVSPQNNDTTTLYQTSNYHSVYYRASDIVGYRNDVYFVLGGDIYRMKKDGSENPVQQPTGFSTYTGEPVPVQSIYIYENNNGREDTPALITTTTSAPLTAVETLPTTTPTSEDTGGPAHTTTTSVPFTTTMTTEASPSQTVDRAQLTTMTTVPFTTAPTVDTFQIIAIGLVTLILFLTVVAVVVVFLRRRREKLVVNAGNEYENRIPRIHEYDTPPCESLQIDNLEQPEYYSYDDNENLASTERHNQMYINGDIGADNQGIQEVGYANTQPTQCREYINLTSNEIQPNISRDLPLISDKYHYYDNNGASYINTAQHGRPEVTSEEGRTLDDINSGTSKSSTLTPLVGINVSGQLLHEDGATKNGVHMVNGDADNARGGFSGDVGNDSGPMTQQECNIGQSGQTSPARRKCRTSSGDYDEHHLWRHLVADSDSPRSTSRSISIEFVRDEDEDDVFD